ncbi:hypothetical protein PIB30_000594 [Stylosanthes scabra]|uniref:Uncharacterized protein n=1 Tax=Stylosanthes scabra TaxID=79078 RepID=A0ABU6X176_9FABA|nr:hypothetical protein [Stylosanthes scabra]
MQVLLMKARTTLSKDNENEGIGKRVVNEESFSVDQDHVNLDKLMELAAEIQSTTIGATLKNLLGAKDTTARAQIGEGRNLGMNENLKTNECITEEINPTDGREEDKKMQLTEEMGKEVAEDRKGKGIINVESGPVKLIKKYKPKPVAEYYVEMPEDSDEDEQKSDDKSQQGMELAIYMEDVLSFKRKKDDQNQMQVEEINELERAEATNSTRTKKMRSSNFCDMAEEAGLIKPYQEQ